MKYDERQLSALRQQIEADAGISEKRKLHIFAVEEMAARLGGLYIPEKLDILRAASLLHDLTKEYSAERQVEICRSHGHNPSQIELFAPKTFHARTAAYLIPELYPEFADDEVISAVRWHTTGHAGMTLTEKLVYLADYIDESRKFADCVMLRHAFFDAKPEEMSADDRRRHLREILILSYNLTITALLEGGKPISPDTTFALNDLICDKYCEINKQEII